MKSFCKKFIILIFLVVYCGGISSYVFADSKSPYFKKEDQNIWGKDSYYSLLNLVPTATMTMKDGNNHSIERWYWNQGVALIGMMNIYKVNKDSDILNFLNSQMEHFLSKENPSEYKQPLFYAPKDSSHVRHVNDMPHAAVMAYLYSINKKPEYKQVIDAVYEAAKNWSAIASDGCFLHYYENSIGVSEYSDWIWADTAYMAGEFLIEYYKATGNKEALNIAIKQGKLHFKNLYNESFGLFYHGADSDQSYKGLYGDKGNGYFWGRGNGWMISFYVDLAEILKKENNSEYPYFKNLISTYLSKVLKYQDFSGFWRQLINDSNSYLETSVTQMFTYSILKAKRLNIINDDSGKFYESLKKSINGLFTKVSLSSSSTIFAGQIQDVCISADIGSTFSHYNSEYPAGNHSKATFHGQGTFMNFISEYLLLLKYKGDINIDGKTDLSDINDIALHWGETDNLKDVDENNILNIVEVLKVAGNL
jgi:rhamnogalacturonyl hydrolase YesR